MIPFVRTPLLDEEPRRAVKSYPKTCLFFIIVVLLGVAAFAKFCVQHPQYLGDHLEKVRLPWNNKEESVASSKIQVTVEKYASGDKHCKGEIEDTLTFAASYKDCTERPDGVHVRYNCKEGTLQETRYEGEGNCQSGKDGHITSYNEHGECNIVNGESVTWSGDDSCKKKDLSDAKEKLDAEEEKKKSNKISITVKKYASDDKHCAGEVVDTLSYTAKFKDCTTRPDGVQVRYNCKEGSLQETRYTGEGSCQSGKDGHITSYSEHGECNIVNGEVATWSSGACCKEEPKSDPKEPEKDPAKEENNSKTNA